MSDVRLDMHEFNRFMRQLKPLSRPLRRAFRVVAQMYRSFLKRRFVRLSKGGGEWPPLKTPRKIGAIEYARVLWDTGVLIGALDPTFANLPGQLEADLRDGIRVGFGGPGRHPKGLATIADIAGFHQVGAGDLPIRRIIVDPDISTHLQIRTRIRVGVKELIRGL